MASIDYPSTLPAPKAGTLKETSLEPWVSDSATVGAPRRRKRFTRALRRWTYQLLLSSAQKATLLTFYDTTLDDGVSEFNWTDRDGNVHEVRFASRPEPDDADGKNWIVQMSLEEI